MFLKTLPAFECGLKSHNNAASMVATKPISLIYDSKRGFNLLLTTVSCSTGLVINTPMLKQRYWDKK